MAASAELQRLLPMDSVFTPTPRQGFASPVCCRKLPLTRLRGGQSKFRARKIPAARFTRFPTAIHTALGYVLIERLRALALQGTKLATAQVETLRIKLLKLAAVITRNTRRIRLYLASNWPSADIFVHVMRQLHSP